MPRQLLPTLLALLAPTAALAHTGIGVQGTHFSAGLPTCLAGAVLALG